MFTTGVPAVERADDKALVALATCTAIAATAADADMVSVVVPVMVTLTMKGTEAVCTLNFLITD